MGVHYIAWHATASGVEDEFVIADAMSWLVGNNEIVEIEETSSYYGSNLHVITAELKSKGAATKSLQRLGPDALEEILSTLEQRIDDEKTIHIRLDLHDLISGKINLADVGNRPTIKGKTKLQVYPGDDVLEVANKTLKKAIKDALHLRLPEK
ncbi:MAG: RNA-binding domain-containing protein [Candidatus Poseidoniaceae archaeon]|jgi:RNA binding exosome subunit|nr:RNA-binding domain-containing protein [Candidatus Poseidoniaceae archaeon]